MGFGEGVETVYVVRMPEGSVAAIQVWMWVGVLESTMGTRVAFVGPGKVRGFGGGFGVGFVGTLDTDLGLDLSRAVFFVLFDSFGLD